MASGESSHFDRHIQQLRKCEILLEAEVEELCDKGKEVLIRQPNVVQVHTPVTVCGDIHGQIFDLQVFNVYVYYLYCLVKL